LPAYSNPDTDRYSHGYPNRDADVNRNCDCDRDCDCDCDPDTRAKSYSYAEGAPESASATVGRRSNHSVATNRIRIPVAVSTFET
jgi:hypothetical protein